MKHVLMLFVIVISSKAIAQTGTEMGTLTFDQEILDYGLVAQNDNGERTFTFKNTGDAPVIINKVKGSCGCTVATLKTKTILPGEQSEITVTYDTNRLGRFTKTVTIYSNAKEPQKVIKIKGTIMTEAQIAAVNN